MSNLYRGPSIDASYHVSVHMAEGFQRRLKCEKITDAKWWQKLTLPLSRWAKNPKGKKQPWKIRGNPRFDSIFYNIAPVFKRTSTCPRLKNDFPSFWSSLYVRTTNIYWRNSSLFSTTHPTFLHSWRFRRSTEPGLSFEAGCRRNSTYTLYSAAGYFLCMKDKKCVIP